MFQEIRPNRTPALLQECAEGTQIEMAVVIVSRERALGFSGCNFRTGGCVIP